MAAKDAGRVLLMSPIPRYITAKCCADPKHITNFGDAEYRDLIEEVAGNAQR